MELCPKKKHYIFPRRWWVNIWALWDPIIDSNFRPTILQYLVSTTGQHLQWWSYIHGYYLNICISLWGKDCYLHFRDKEKVAHQLSKLPNILQFAQIWKPYIFILLQFSFYYILRNHGIHWTIKRHKHPFHCPNEDIFWGMKYYDNKQKNGCSG